MRKPNFFLVGAPKAGTTSLYHYLDQHPDIYMSPMKEPCHFSLESRPENNKPSLRAEAEQLEKDVRKHLHGPMEQKRSGGIVREWEDYLRLFAGATTQRMVGEASVGYLESKSAPGEIARRIPAARILIVLRSPAERAFSQYLHFISDGLIAGSFRDHVRACLRHNGEGLGTHRPFLEAGFYAEQVERYLRQFPREQVGIWIYEETKAQPREFLREVMAFLGVDSAFVPDMTKRHHEPQIAKMVRTNGLMRRLGVWQVCRRLAPAGLRPRLREVVYRKRGSVTMNAGDRVLMQDLYRGNIRRLEGVLNRDLGAWLI